MKLYASHMATRPSKLIILMSGIIVLNILVNLFEKNDYSRYDRAIENGNLIYML